MKQPLLNAKNAIQKLPKPSFENFKIFNERFSIVHEFVIRVAVIFGLITLTYFFLKEMTSNKYVLTTVEVAHSIEESKNEKIKIFPSDLRQQITRKVESIIEDKKNNINTDLSASESVSNETSTINIGGFDLNQIFLYFRSFLKMQNREIKAYLTENEDTADSLKNIIS